MLKLKKIAITGGLASGKTTVCQFFEELGACVVHADAIVHKLLDPRTDLGKRVIQLLGTGIVQGDTISRSAVAKEVFCSPAKLKALESLLHPAVFQRIEELYEEALKSCRYTSFVVEIPLLFESGAEKFYDVIVAVKTSEEIARKRSPSLTAYDERMKRQMSPEEKAQRAHFVLTNDQTREDLRQQVIALYQTLHI